VAANNELTPLQRGVMLMIVARPNQTAEQISEWFLDDSPAKVKQAISDLVQKNMISGGDTQPLTYRVVGGEL
jgi:hypothetical protein